MIPLLQELGLPPKEAKVYLACLELGVASAVSIIAKKAGVNRTTAYDVLEQLVQKGILISLQHKSQRSYEALPPEKFIAYLKEQSEKFSKLAGAATQFLPELKTHYRASGRPKIYFYEGEEGLKRVYEETLSSTEEILAYASDQANQDALPDYFPLYYKRRTAKKIPIRALFPDTPKDRERHALDAAEMRRSRILPKAKLDFTPEINFFDNKIMIADWKEKLGIIIESKEIANVFKQTFELAWEAAEKYHHALIDDFVDIRDIDGSIRIELRYAGKNNFAKKVFYQNQAPLLRRDAVQALARAQKRLGRQNLGLKIWDAYRPIEVQRELWKILPDERYVANPDKDPHHCQGTAVDLTLVDSDGKELNMGTDHDNFTERAHRSYKKLPAQILKNRAILEKAMEAEGFRGFPTEWWHFDYIAKIGA